MSIVPHDADAERDDDNITISNITIWCLSLGRPSLAVFLRSLSRGWVTQQWLWY